MGNGREDWRGLIASPFFYINTNMKPFKQILSEAKKSKPKEEIKVPEDRQKEYDEHYDKLYDRGGMSHDQIHNEVLSRMGLKR